MAKIHFFSEGIAFKVPKPRITAHWIERIARQEKAAIKSINYIFCTDAYLIQINQDFLNHSTYTDIITFDYTEPKTKQIQAEIYISVERVKENAAKFKTSFENELRRVVIHGVLHLLGYGDKTPAQKALMRKKEEACLSLFK